jgi:hypothetical protein
MIIGSIPVDGYPASIANRGASATGVAAAEVEGTKVGVHLVSARGPRTNAEFERGMGERSGRAA